MSSKTDHPDGPGTLPEPELNPLLNPVLGQNMGRWAEVYFTSPPEKREQAVLELLHELQAENAALDGTASTSATPAQEESSEPVFEPASKIPEVSRARVRCHACGRENPGSHRFCGMCGSPVGEQAAEPSALIEDTREDTHSEERTPRSQGNRTTFLRHEEAVDEPALTTSELSQFQGGRERSYRDGREDEIFSYSPASRSYRVYVGIGLAMVIFALGYMAWRGAQVTSQNSHVEPQAPPAVTQPVAQAPAPPPSASSSTSKTDTPDGATPVNQKAVIPPPPVRNPIRNDEDARIGSDKSTHAIPPPAPVAETNPLESSVAGNGSEELVIAQRYLTGGDSLQRNSAEAAKWLWKSMAKHNANATLLLADLYLKGDGVSKNCDQARVLLDSAARSGMKQAGEQLRHLQAFGCE